MRTEHELRAIGGSSAAPNRPIRSLPPVGEDLTSTILNTWGEISDSDPAAYEHYVALTHRAAWLNHESSIGA